MQIYRNYCFVTFQTADEFRQRLSTYPLNGQIIRRPAIKVKKPHVEEEDCSSIPDIITTQHGGKYCTQL